MPNKFTPIKKGDKINKYTFLRTPRELVYDEEYMHISVMAKYLLSIMMDRMDLSAKNEWLDKDGSIYIILTHEEAQRLLGCSESKVKKLYAELRDNRFIQSKKQGLCKPNMIYINAVLFEESIKENPQENTDKTVQKDAEKLSGQVLKNSQDRFGNTSNNNNNKNIKNSNTDNNNLSKAEQSKIWMEERLDCKEYIKDLISYDYLIANNYDEAMINDITDSMVNALCTEEDYVKVGKDYIPLIDVKRKLYSLDVNSIASIHDKLKRNKAPVYNASAYLLTALYRYAGCKSVDNDY